MGQFFNNLYRPMTFNTFSSPHMQIDSGVWAICPTQWHNIILNSWCNHPPYLEQDWLRLGCVCITDLVEKKLKNYGTIKARLSVWDFFWIYIFRPSIYCSIKWLKKIHMNLQREFMWPLIKMLDKLSSWVYILSFCCFLTIDSWQS